MKQNASPGTPHPASNELIQLTVYGERARATIGESGMSEDFRVWEGRRLTPSVIEERVLALPPDDRTPLLVLFDLASPRAKALLRQRRISYAGATGELFLITPRILIERPPRTARPDRPEGVAIIRAASEGPSPFSNRGSRIARWLLANPDASPSISELVRRTGVSQPYASQVVRSLREETLVELSPDIRDARKKRVTVPSRGRLIDAWADAWRTKRVRESIWDVGASRPEEALARWSRAAGHVPELRWGFGGVSGAVYLARAVEPSDLLVWVDPQDLARWQELLTPEEGRRHRGALRLVWAPDPFMLDLVSTRAGACVCDAAQLYLDCLREGERVLEQAEAIRKVMSW